jgi:hypothetical protein
MIQVVEYLWGSEFNTRYHKKEEGEGEERRRRRRRIEEGEEEKEEEGGEEEEKEEKRRKLQIKKWTLCLKEIEKGKTREKMLVSKTRNGTGNIIILCKERQKIN